MNLKDDPGMVVLSCKTVAASSEEISNFLAVKSGELVTICMSMGSASCTKPLQQASSQLNEAIRRLTEVIPQVDMRCWSWKPSDCARSLDGSGGFCLQYSDYSRFGCGYLSQGRISLVGGGT